MCVLDGSDPAVIEGLIRNVATDSSVVDSEPEAGRMWRGAFVCKNRSIVKGGCIARTAIHPPLLSRQVRQLDFYGELAAGNCFVGATFVSER